MRQSARLGFLAAVCLGLASHGLAGGSSVFKIPVKAIGAPPPKAVTVEYLRGDGSVVQQLSKVPGSSEARIAAEGFESVEVSLSHATLGISLPALSTVLVKWPFQTESSLPSTIDVHLLPREKRLASSRAATRVQGTDTF